MQKLHFGLLLIVIPGCPSRSALPNPFVTRVKRSFKCDVQICFKAIQNWGSPIQLVLFEKWVEDRHGGQQTRLTIDRSWVRISSHQTLDGNGVKVTPGRFMFPILVYLQKERNYSQMGSLHFQFIVYIRCCHFITKRPPIFYVAKNWQLKERKLPTRHINENIKKCY